MCIGLGVVALELEIGEIQVSDLTANWRWAYIRELSVLIEMVWSRSWTTALVIPSGVLAFKSGQ